MDVLVTIVGGAYVVCEVPEARLSVNDKKSSLIAVYFNTKACFYIYVARVKPPVR